MKSREQAYAAIDAALASAYETGFLAGEKQARGPACVRWDDMSALCDRLMVFQKTIGTKDHRYVMLGEIIGDFQRVLS